MTTNNLLQRISPLWLGLAISSFLLIVFFVAESVLGRWDALLSGDDFDPLARVSGGILRDVRLAIVHCLMIGYITGAFLQTLRNGQRTVLELQGVLDCTRRECEELAATVRLSNRVLLVVGLTGFVLALFAPYIAPPVPDAPWHPSSWNAEVTWHRIIGPAMIIMLLWHTYAVVMVSTRLSNIARRLGRIDLLDHAPLAPFTRLGLNNALLVIGGLSIFSLMLIETGFGITMLVIGVPVFVVALVAFLYPVRGVRDRIRQTKDDELQIINAAISEQRASFLADSSGHRRGEMADLIAYRRLVEDVPEWPFTISNYARFALYLLIPAFSWGLGVVAEEFVSRALF